jgi:hypothetical protein
MKKREIANSSTSMQHHPCKAGNTLLKMLKLAKLEISKEMIAFSLCLMAMEGLKLPSIARKISFGLYQHSFCKITDKRGSQMHFFRLINN